MVPRVKRGLVDGFIYHVINRGNDKQQVFHKCEDYKAFVDLMAEAKSRYSIQIFAYCLMPNHFHMLLMPDNGEEMSKWMQWLMTSHVRRYHRHYGTSGHVWQGRFKSFIIQKDAHLLAVVRYIEANPVRAALVESARDWNWSSHLETLSERMRNLVDEIPTELPSNWQEYVDKPMTDRELERVRLSVNRQSPYGVLEWQIKITKELGLESTIRPRGRPKKNRQKVKSSLSPF